MCHIHLCIPVHILKFSAWINWAIKFVDLTTQTTVAHFQMDSLSVGYFFRLSSSAWMVVLRPALVVMRHEERRPRRASRISAEDS